MAESSKLKIWRLASIILAVIGIGLSLYSINHHHQLKALGQTDAACNINATFSCDDVARSPYSEIFNIPLGVWGLGFFAALALLAFFSTKENKLGSESRQGFALFAFGGAVISVILAIISSTVVGAWCLICIGVYITTFLIGGLTLYAKDEVLSEFNLNKAFSGAGNGALVIGALVLLYSFGFSPKQAPEQAQDSRPEKVSANDLMQQQAKEIPVSMSPYSGLGEDYRKGGDQAKVVITEFADFECPACGQFSQVARQLAQIYRDRILIVFRNYPLDKSCNPMMKRELHKNACLLARMARCAGQYGYFWEYHNIAFDKQKEASEVNARKWARDVGLMDEQITTCMQSESIMDKIRDDIKVGDAVGVQGTPAIYINGREYVGRRDLDSMRETIDALLNAS